MKLILRFIGKILIVSWFSVLAVCLLFLLSARFVGQNDPSKIVLTRTEMFISLILFFLIFKWAWKNSDIKVFESK